MDLPKFSTSSAALLAACVQAACSRTDGSGLVGAATAVTASDSTSGMGSTGVTAGVTAGGEATTVSSAGASSSDGPNCGVQEFILAAVPPNVMLVLDKSGSMLTRWDGDGDPMTAEVTRWSSLHAVVESVVTTFDAEINFGANLFPSTMATGQLGLGACPVRGQPEVPVAPRNGVAVLAGIPPQEAAGIVGATPASAGITVALEHLRTLDPAVGRVMVLVTDGAANCGADADQSLCPGTGCGLLEEYDQNLPRVVGAAFDEGVPTFVVGIDIVDALTGVGDDGVPEVNTFEELNRVAEAGGKARFGAEKFFNATNEAELQAALSEIAGQVVTCQIPLTSKPLHPDFVEVEIDGESIPRVRDCEVESGWTYANVESPYEAIVLCGDSCDRLARVGKLDTIFGCPPAG